MIGDADVPRLPKVRIRPPWSLVVSGSRAGDGEATLRLETPYGSDKLYRSMAVRLAADGGLVDLGKLLKGYNWRLLITNKRGGVTATLTVFGSGAPMRFSVKGSDPSQVVGKLYARASDGLATMPTGSCSKVA